MSGIQLSEAKAPWVAFERRAIEDREGSISAGAYRTKDVDYVLITPAGSKDLIEREAAEWFAAKEQDVREARFEASWLSAYRKAYDQWVSGQEIPLEGTAIRNWPVVSPAQVRLLTDMHVLTVEVLAGANEQLIGRLGMGGRVMVDKAKDFLRQAKDGGKVVEELSKLRVENEALTGMVKTLAEQVQALRAGFGAVMDSAPAPAREDISTGELFDDLPQPVATPPQPTRKL